MLTSRKTRFVVFRGAKERPFAERKTTVVSGGSQPETRNYHRKPNGKDLIGRPVKAAGDVHLEDLWGDKKRDLLFDGARDTRDAMLWASAGELATIGMIGVAVILLGFILIRRGF